MKSIISTKSVRRLLERFFQQALIKSLNHVIRKATKNRRIFPNDTSAVKPTCLVVGMWPQNGLCRYGTGELH